MRKEHGVRRGGSLDRAPHALPPARRRPQPAVSAPRGSEQLHKCLVRGERPPLLLRSA
jgi:hypothetical protein